MKNRLTVMVTGVGGGGYGEQILKALRRGETEYNIVGCDMTPFSKGLMAVDHAQLLPPATEPGYVDAVLAAADRHGVQALFPGSEPELKVLAAAADRLDRHGLFMPVNPAPVVDLCLDKSQTMEALTALGFAVPRSVTVRTPDDLEDIAFLPAVLKPSIGGGGSMNIFLAQTPEELRVFGRYLLGLYPEYIVQEYVGNPESEFTVGVLMDMDGELLNSIAIKRMILSGLSNRLKAPNRSGNPALGPVLAISSGISQGTVGRYPEVTGPCEQIALALGCRGPVNIQCRLVGDQVVVFEINPRFSGTTSLRAMVGYNEPDVLVRRHLFGELITPHFPYRSAVIMRGLEETEVDLRQVEAGNRLSMASTNRL